MYSWYEFVPYTYNVGDNVGIDIMHAITSCRIRSATNMELNRKPVILGVGSTLHHLKSGIVWGTGAMEQTKDVYRIKGTM